MRTIGVLGGMGPAATVDLFTRLVAGVAADCDQAHPPVVVFNATQTPDRAAHLIGGGPDPTPALRKAARVLERAGADFIAVPCNSAHAYLGAMQESVGIPILDMIALAAQRVRAGHAEGTRVGILAAAGTIRTRLYERSLSAVGLVAAVPEPEVQAEVMAAIYAVKAGSRGPDARLGAAIASLMAAGAEALLLGCTELPLALDTSALPVPTVDAATVLARACLERAGVPAGAIQ